MATSSVLLKSVYPNIRNELALTAVSNMATDALDLNET